MACSARFFGRSRRVSYFTLNFMSWLCINCETVNFDSHVKCMVCGEERYYTNSEMLKLLENHPEAKTLREENKKINTQIKWLQTRNRNLTTENKQLQLLILQETPKTSQEIEIKKETDTQEKPLPKESPEPLWQDNIPIDLLEKKWRTKVLFWKISTFLAATVAIGLFLTNGRIAF